MGSGLAGLSAAVTAAKKGVKVAVFEKRPFQGGGVSNTPMATIVTRNEGEYQAKWNANPYVVRAWINNSYRIPEFIKDLGLDFLGVMENPLEAIGVQHPAFRGFPAYCYLGDFYMLKPRGKGHGAALICLNAVRKLKELGGEIYFNITINSFIKDGDVMEKR